MLNFLEISLKWQSTKETFCSRVSYKWFRDRWSRSLPRPRDNWI